MASTVVVAAAAAAAVVVVLVVDFVGVEFAGVADSSWQRVEAWPQTLKT